MNNHTSIFTNKQENLLRDKARIFGPVFTRKELTSLGDIKVDNGIIVNAMDLGPIDKNYRNFSLDSLHGKKISVLCDQIILKEVRDIYQNVNFLFDPDFHNDFILVDDLDLSNLVSTDRTIDFTNFVLCFNHGQSVVRQCLTSSLYKLKMWNSGFCTKYFISTRDQIDGNISHFCGNEVSERYYRKFIIDDSDSATDFYNSKITNPVQISQMGRLGNLVPVVDKIKSSFITIVSESLAESYQPYFTEKFLFPIISRSLWISSAQPNWHKQLVDQYGFKIFNNIFDYSFDTVENPIKRTVDLLSMLCKFKELSKFDWHDLYLIEKDTIDFNHDHYYSKKYLYHLKNYVTNKL